MKVVATISGILGTVVLVAFSARRHFHALVARDVRRLFSSASAGVGPEQLRARWGTLPEPIRRYFGFAVREGTPPIRTARLQHEGFFRTNPDQRWLRIKGQQYFTTAAPGFVWHATVRALPLLWIEARDCLLNGHGNMLVKLESTFPIADASGAQIDQGASLRWLAECAWFPYGFVGDTVAWDAIDARSARATLRTGGVPATGVVEVDDEGRLVCLRAERYLAIGGAQTVLTPWTGRYSEYREWNGFRIPASVEVSWELEEGTFSYALFGVTRLEYNVADRF